MIASRSLQRANTIPEMALVLSLVMLTLFGIIQYALVGFNQIGSDGAAFVGDHATVAYYGNPTQTNQGYAQQVAQVAFPHAAANFSGQVPKNMTYEMDVTQTHQSLQLAQLFPATTQSYSRIVEPSQSLQSPQSGGGQCAVGPEKILYNNTTILSNKAVALLGNVPTDQLYQKIQTSNGTALQFNLGLLNNNGTENQLLLGISTNFSATVKSLAQLTAALNTIQAIPGVGNGLSTALSTQIAPLLASATGGTYVSAGATGGAIQSQIPLGTAAFSTQLGVTTQAIGKIEAGTGGLSALVNQLLTTVVNPILFGTQGAVPTSLLPSGGLLSSNGPLMLLNTAQSQLSALDATTSCL